MPLGLSETEGLALAEYLTGPSAWWQLHVGDPGPDGTANLSAHTARFQVTFANPPAIEVVEVAGTFTTCAVRANTGSVTIPDWPTTELPTHLTLWTFASGGTFRLSGRLQGDPVLAGGDLQIPVGGIAVRVPVAA